MQQRKTEKHSYRSGFGHKRHSTFPTLAVSKANVLSLVGWRRGFHRVSTPHAREALSGHEAGEDVADGLGAAGVHEIEDFSNFRFRFSIFYVALFQFS